MFGGYAYGTLAPGQSTLMLQQDFSELFEDSALFGDVVSLALSKPIDDAVVFDDSFARVVAFIRTVAEDLEVSDNAETLVSMLLQVDDIVQFSDSLSFDVDKAVIDIVNFTDVLQKSIMLILADSVEFEDAAARLVSYIREFTESVEFEDDFYKDIATSEFDEVVWDDLVSKGVDIPFDEYVEFADLFRRSLFKGIFRDVNEANKNFIINDKTDDRNIQAKSSDRAVKTDKFRGIIKGES